MRLKDDLQKYNGEGLARAVVSVYKQLQEGDEKPGSDFWVMNSFGRRELASRVINEWCLEVEMSYVYFPFKDDTIIDVYLSYRKMNKSQKIRFEKELNIRKSRERRKT